MFARFHQFLRFCVVGLIGFVVDAAALELFVWFGLPAPFARVISMNIALQCTYLMHRSFTFKGHGNPRKAWIKFMAANLTGALINYLVFLAALTYSPFSEPLLQRQFALFCGMGVAVNFNYWATRRFVFGARKPE